MSPTTLFASRLQPDRPQPAKQARLPIRRRLLGRGSRLRTLGLAAGLLVLGLTLGQSARAFPLWDGTPGNWYSNPSHWEGGGYPGSADEPENLSLATITLNQLATVHRFYSNGAFVLSGGGTFMGTKLDAGTDLTVSNIFTISGGTVKNCTIQPGLQDRGGPVKSVVFVGNGSTPNTLNRLDGTIINANLDLSTNANASVRFLNTNTINGGISLGASNALSIYDGSSNLVLNGNVSGAGLILQEIAGAATLNNNGLINANIAGQTLTLLISNSFNNVGATMEATNGGILQVTNNSSNNNTTNNGTLAAIGGGVINLNAFNGGTFTGGATGLFDSVGGTINVAGAALLGTFNGTAGSSLVFSGDNSVNTGNSLKNTTSNITLDLSTHADAFANFIGTNTVNGAITLGNTAPVSGVFITGPNGTGNLVLGSRGSLTGFGTVKGDALTNNGLVSANAAGKTLSLSPGQGLNNAGATLAATNGGTLSLNNSSLTNNGNLTASGVGSVVSINGGINGSVFTGGAGGLITTAGGGQVQVNGASLRGTLNGTAGSSLTFNSNTGNSLKNTASNITLDFATHGDAFARFIDTNTVNGAIMLGTTAAGSGLVLSSNSRTVSLILGRTGSLSGFGTVSEESSGTLTNNGLVNANVVNQTLTLNVDNFTNAGTTRVAGGAALLVNAPSTTSGFILVQAGGAAAFSFGLTQTSGLTQVDGVLNLLRGAPLNLESGVLDGTGTVNGSVVNTGGTISPGDSPGTLTINGGYTQSSGGTLNFEFTNTSHDLLNVSGLVTLGGVLDVNYLGSAPYSGGVGSQFAFLNYGILDTIPNGGFTVVGHNGFTFDLVNDTANNTLSLKVLTVSQPVPEASTTVSFGLLLLLGLGWTVIAAKRKKTA